MFPTVHTKNIFQSTPSTRRETCGIALMIPMNKLFQSTPSTRRETENAILFRICHNISIHSLHTEGDGRLIAVIVDMLYFNPLPPHGGRLRNDLDGVEWKYFNPLPPHGGRPCLYNVIPEGNNFNPLPPHGGRLRFRCNLQVDVVFQSTPSTRRETELLAF